MKTLVKAILSTTLLILGHLTAKSQEIPSLIKRSAEEVINQMNEEDLGEFTQEEILHALNQLIINPIDINTDELNPLLENRLLNELQYLQLQAYLKKRGRIHSVFELEYIDGFDRETLLQILPFIFVGEQVIKPEFSSRKISKIYGSADLLYKESLLSEDPDQKALGSRPAMRFSGRLKAGKSWQAFLRAEKDAWEAFDNQGFDHYSGYLHWKSRNQVSEAILGNFQIQSGQGAGNFSGAYQFRSAENPENIRLYQRGIKPYGGGDENNPLQGLAFSTRWKLLKMNAYGSLRYRDAILNELQEVTSLLNTGLHIDSLSYSRRKNLQEKAAGVNLILYLKSFHLGIHSQWKAYDHTILTENPDGSMAKYDQTANHSLDYQYNRNNLNVFGEIFLDHAGNIHQSHGLVYQLHPNFQLAGQFRALGQDLFGLNRNSSAIGLPIGEESSYLGAKIIFNSKIRLSLYLEKQEKQHPDYLADHPTEKLNLQARLNWHPSRSTQVFLHYQHKRASEKNPENSFLSQYSEETLQQSARIQLTHEIQEGLSWQSRLDLKVQHVEEGVSLSGSMMYHGIRWEINERFSLKARYAWFSTNDFSFAFSVYEDDLPGLFSNAILYEKGQRFYLVMKAEMKEDLIVYLKIAESNFYGKSLIGEGIGSVQGHRKPELSLLIRYLLK